MFTLIQIQEAHSKVKSGADFPAYIREIKNLGVTSYEVFVEDGHTDYFGENQFKVSAKAKYETLNIAEAANTEQFRSDLRAHQEGASTYMNFCEDCAKSGIEKWLVSTGKMTCTYYDKAGNEVLLETIPE